MIDAIKKHWLLLAVLLIVGMIVLQIWNTVAQSAEDYFRRFVMGGIAYFALFCLAVVTGDTAAFLLFAAVAFSLLNHIWNWFNADSATQGTGPNLDWIQSVADTVSGGNTNAMAPTPTVPSQNGN